MFDVKEESITVSENKTTFQIGVTSYDVNWKWKVSQAIKSCNKFKIFHFCLFVFIWN